LHLSAERRSAPPVQQGKAAAVDDRSFAAARFLIT
jgi:hypothetical protein